MTSWKRKPPRVADLTRAQYSGWDCCWCGKRLTHGARSAGRAQGSSGAYDLSVEVYECGRRCPARPRRPTSSRTGDTP
ncbi:hypothetical protein ACFWBS_50995 [Streptomyces mirabilis]|uniref:hypothetical protein n=1 Tax=Streptomyces TaxID=1883 RepID=UPI000BDAC183|nr:hypothetical protein [Streptomyces sp. OK228]SOE24784.1 hypothetical protein SAMN05442782_1432 [Streptomyces sp. OK228]